MFYLREQKLIASQEFQLKHLSKHKGKKACIIPHAMFVMHEFSVTVSWGDGVESYR